MVVPTATTRPPARFAWFIDFAASLADLKLFTLNTVVLDLVFADRLESCIAYMMCDFDRTDPTGAQRINYCLSKMQAGRRRRNCPSTRGEKSLIPRLIDSFARHPLNIWWQRRVADLIDYFLKAVIRTEPDAPSAILPNSSHHSVKTPITEIKFRPDPQGSARLRQYVPFTFRIANARRSNNTSIRAPWPAESRRTPFSRAGKTRVLLKTTMSPGSSSSGISANSLSLHSRRLAIENQHSRSVAPLEWLLRDQLFWKLIVEI